MTQPKPKLLRNTIITIIVAVIVLIIAIGFILKEYDRHRIDIDAAVHMGVITTIISVMITIALVTTTVILVLITKTYADQTTRMADETAKMAKETKSMVDFYYQKRKDDVMPLFIPHKEGYIFSVNILKFKLTNAGKDALFVEIKTEELDNECKKFMYRVAQWEYVEFGHFKDLELMKKMASKVLNKKPLIVHINICFQDTLLNKYNQTIKFYWSELEEKRQFSVDLPIEQNKKSEPT